MGERTWSWGFATSYQGALGRMNGGLETSEYLTVQGHQVDNLSEFKEGTVMIITQITATPETEQAYEHVFGLGEDNKIYEWSRGRWIDYDHEVTESSEIKTEVTTAASPDSDTTTKAEKNANNPS